MVTMCAGDSSVFEDF